jgi:hypothetical protein
MKLHLPDLIRHLKDEPIGSVFLDGQIAISRPRDSARPLLVSALMPKLHKAEKYIFDSGTDTDEETTNAVRETAVAMMSFGIFHLPAPLIWIEDPFSSDVDPLGAYRRYYLCSENEEGIKISAMQNVSPEELALIPPERHKFMPRYTIVGSPCIIDPRIATDKFLILGTHAEDYVVPDMKKFCAEVVYAVKKFVVSLAAAQTVRERIEPARVRGASASARRAYAHTIVRVPSFIPAPSTNTGTGTPQGTGKRRMGLVSGYVWGKNTRPLEEQRWIAPFWRGNEALGVVEPKVRIVTAKS